MCVQYCDYMVEQLKNLLSISSPVGYTDQISEYVRKELSSFGLISKELKKGGLIVDIGGEGNAAVIVAHLDTIGLMVQSIKSDGKLTASNLGGVNATMVEASNVSIITRYNGSYSGTIQLHNPSMHVNFDNVGAPRNFNENVEVVLDEKVFTAQDTKDLGICAGDFIDLDPNLKITSSGFIKSRFLDDKAAVAILLGYIKYVIDNKIKLSRKVYALFTCFEEVGVSYAPSIPEEVDEVMALDIGCVGDIVDGNEFSVSICAKDNISPYDYNTVTKLVDIARKNNINYALDVFPRYGSDASLALRFGCDIKASLIGPGVYASHGYERTHIEGLNNTLKLLIAYFK